MKNNIVNLLVACVLPLMAITGCSEERMYDEQYKKELYIVGAVDKVRQIEVKYSDEIQDAHISLAAGGTLLNDKNVTVELEESDEAITAYNDKYIPETKIRYQKLESSLYSWPSKTALLPAGEVYTLFPFKIKTTDLDCDLLYALTFKIASVSEYSINTGSPVLILTFKFINDYSGSYKLEGKKTEQVAGAVGNTLSMVRELTAINETTVRAFNQTSEEEANRDNSCFTIKINPDNSLTIDKWKNSTIFAGGGTFDPEIKVYTLWYNYKDGNRTYKVEGKMTFIPKLV